jgi:hypothetical protein
MMIKILTATLLSIAAVITPFFVSPIQAQEPHARSVWDGVYTKGQAKRGEQLYGMHCASCHGQALEGAGEAPALVGGEFLDKWVGLKLSDLFERIQSTMPQDDPERLGRDAKTYITAYLLMLNQFPAGKIELPADAQLMKEIRIDAAKPDEMKK